MKNLLAFAPLCLLSLSLAAGQEASKSSSLEDQIKKLEQNWVQATVKEGAAAVDQYEADDIITTDPSGRVTDRVAILFTNVMDRADVGMVQRGGSLCFPLKTGQRLRISSNFVGQELQGDKTVQPGVFRLVDHTHPAAAQFLNDAVV